VRKPKLAHADRPHLKSPHREEEPASIAKYVNESSDESSSHLSGFPQEALNIVE
jgi:hypothetical protein